MSSSAIGVFDSGLGGLTVLKELRAAMPNESFVYLGDVARLPYGTKSSAVVTRYAKSCARFFDPHETKLMVVACNTATAMALPALKTAEKSEVFGVIAPGVRAARQVTRKKKVLVLATPSTVRSGAYLQEFKLQDPSISVQQLACPLLVPLAEEGWFNHSATAEVIRHYLSSLRTWDFDTVLLGCTHYPLLQDSFRKVFPEEIAVVHGGQELGKEIRDYLMASGLRNPLSVPGTLRFCATDEIPASLPIVSSLFGADIPFETVDISV
jgi:glutamate racemase